MRSAVWVIEKTNKQTKNKQRDYPVRSLQENDTKKAQLLKCVFLFFFHNQTQIIANRGYPYEEHHVTTEDGFILAMQRIPRGRGEKENSVPKEVVFLQHGILADATNWVMDTPTKSLAYILADSGFDVWLGNIRGNDYSRRHVKYDPDQCKFWNWRRVCQTFFLLLFYATLSYSIHAK